MVRMTHTMTIGAIIDNPNACPLPIGIIPNNMGINLCSVSNIAWEDQEDGQLISLTINFKPATKEDNK